MYSVREALLIRKSGNEQHCYFILKDGLPIFEINKWLEYKGINSSRTSKKYSFELCKFLNYLLSINKHYRDVTKKDIVRFIDYLLFSNDKNTFVSFESNISYTTVSSYLTVIKEFYRYLEDTLNDVINLNYSKSNKRINNNSYLYGQVWDMDIKELLAHKMPRIKKTKDHIKWYSEDEIKAISSNFNSLRDKCIFALTLEGMRIGEVTYLNLEDYNFEDEVIHLSKTKGNKERIVPLKSQTIDLLESYLYNERSVVEEEIGLFDALFVNLKKGKNFGTRVSYRNALNLIKTAAKNAGFNPDEIRTHSGRSTRTMELLKYQSENPDENLTDEQIRLLMGWSSSKSLEPYINQKDEQLLVSLAKKINQSEGGSE
ncbi:tyrosine-type recombinase/integrase [Bacillus wiedmannii]|uniref:tyrosine-type recombinase/integrase n=1 Tax=Bacillus wiedmannii TaxID=1890302 RepID=UPI0035567966